MRSNVCVSVVVLSSKIGGLIPVGCTFNLKALVAHFTLSAVFLCINWVGKWGVECVFGASGSPFVANSLVFCVQ